MGKTVEIGNVSVGESNDFLLIAGPCVIEDFERTFEIARFLQDLTDKLDIPFVFKASYDKANRTSIDAYRGPGVAQGLEILDRVKQRLGLLVLSDVHSMDEIDDAAAVLDIIQIPAFLCRQTDFIVTVSATGKPVNIKKGQFLAPRDMTNVVAKVTAAGNQRLLITERGTTFGYNNLVVDFRGIQIMREMGYPVIFDATHSIQLPGGQGSQSDGQREFVPGLSRAAVAAGVDGIFMEVHPDPDRALCDGPNSMKLDELEDLLIRLKAINSALRQ